MNRHETPPFSLRLFYRTGAFHRPDEFAAIPQPPHLTIHTWSDCTLTELSHHIAASRLSILPDPAIGTRLAFRIIYPNRAAADAPNYTASRFMVKDLGSIVIGDGGKGLDPEDVEAEKTLESANGEKTLGDARFIIGDYVSVAILPPLENGTVAPSSDARMGRGTGAGEAVPLPERAPRVSGRGREREHERENAFRGRPRNGRGARGGGRGGGIPAGEWRRGESIPDALPAGRGRGRWPY